jgi:hypothetical protein
VLLSALSGEMTDVSTRDDLPVVEVVVLDECGDAAWLGRETRVAEFPRGTLIHAVMM